MGRRRCCCTTSGCSATISGTVRGCLSLVLAGCTVEAHDSTSGGTLLASATTDASGNYTLGVVGGTTGNSIVIVFSKSRFVTATTTLTWTSGSTTSTTWKCGGTSSSVNKSLTADTGYRCCLLGGITCADPISETLYLTVGGGTVTMTYDASVSSWVGNTTASAPKLTAVDPSCVCTITTTSTAVGFFLGCTDGSLIQAIGDANCSNCSTPTTPCFLDANYSSGLTWSSTVPTNSCSIAPTRRNLAATITSSSCSPFSWGGTFSTGTPVFSGSWTLTE
jgi:hypothetical protein